MTKPAPFIPLARMSERVQYDRSDSDVALFFSLLLYGECLLKLVVAAMVATIQTDRDRSRYSALYELVRADGLGVWTDVLDTILVGPPSRRLYHAARPAQKQLTQKFRTDWPVEAFELLNRCMEALGITVTSVSKPSVRDWFRSFTVLRNKTRGHGAPKAGQCAAGSLSLERSIALLADQLLIFQLPWAFLHHNLSGKYRVTRLAGDHSIFSPLAGTPNLVNVPDGIYIALDGLDSLARVDLVDSDPDATDFLVANGQFSDTDYEVLSYASNERRRVPSTPYLLPATALPPSHTEGLSELDAIGDCWTNLPQSPSAYIDRVALQRRLLEQLLLERHEILTLTGPGGIGKTTLALRVLHELLRDHGNRYGTVIWFSARDIDLLASGPKPVKPHAVTLNDFAAQLVDLVGSSPSHGGRGAAVERLSKGLGEGIVGSTLFVFDNFETVDGPVEFYKWLDTYIRPPNKVLITTRMREFAGDYPVHVGGLTDDEARQLIDAVSSELGVAHAIDREYQDALVRESDGHPYVIKILLGEVARNPKTVKPERILANVDEILTALFERTFAGLSPATQRIFLLLASWRSVVPEIALEAVILRSPGERMDVRQALDELYRYSLAEAETSQTDDQVFAALPLAAALFGRRKLSASPLKAAVDADKELLLAFGAGRREDVRHGVLPRVRRLLRHVAKQVSEGKSTLAASEPVLHFLAGRVPAIWLEVATLYEESQPADVTEKVKECLRRYLERPEDVRTTASVWRRLADVCERDGDHAGRVHALVEMCEAAGTASDVISSAANQINGIYFELRRLQMDVLDDDERRSLIKRVVDRLETVNEELDATDCSRLAWLYVQLGDPARAVEVTKVGLRLEPSNQHCLGLLERFG